MIELPVVSFFVRGKPEPAGSKRAVSIPGRKFTQLVDANRKAEPWKKTVGGVANYAMHEGQHRIIQGPCCCKMIFVVKRPEGHWLRDGSLSAEGKRKPYPTSPPDTLKLARAVEDAMTDVVYIDDSLIVHEVLDKRYQKTRDEQIGVQVYVWPRLHDAAHEDDEEGGAVLPFPLAAAPDLPRPAA